MLPPQPVLYPLHALGPDRRPLARHGSCSAEERTGPATGSLRATATTTNSPVPSPSYAVSVDGRTPQDLGASASATVSDLVAGTHTVILSGVPDSCTIAGENPRTVEVGAGATTEVGFVVTCAPVTGAIAVTVSTTGESPDPDGYTVVLDNGTSQPVATSGTTTIGGVPAGV